ncbi:MAG: alpha/beta hydrolase, partial [Alphaproteobacteria bacterium]|nr:alpha/beta hydrolase [Alphaproteobacteria bacterium]
VVFFYGGSWRWGSRDQYRFVGEALTRRGFVVAVADYRLHPDVRFPAFVEDGAAAVAWVRRHVADYGGDPAAMFVMGHSAGAHTGALLALDQRYLGAHGLSPMDLSGMIGMSGPYAVNLIEYDSVRSVFARWPEPMDTVPLSFVRGDAPPMLLLHGLKDTLVSPLNTTRFAEALRAEGARVATDLVPGIGHYRIMAAVAKPFERLAPVADRIAGFVRRPDAVG